MACRVPKPCDRLIAEIWVANETHFAVLHEGVEAWNRWRESHPDTRPDLSSVSLSWLSLSDANLGHSSLNGSHLNHTQLMRADLYRATLASASLYAADFRNARIVEASFTGANMTKADLREAEISFTDFTGAHLVESNFEGAKLIGSDLSKTNLFEASLKRTQLKAAKFLWANLTGVNLREANLRGANLTGATLIDADLSFADLSNANLRFARLIDSKLDGANLTGCRVYGVSAWNLSCEGTVESELIITPGDEMSITVDNLEVAQFLYLLLNNSRIRQCIDTITSKVVLILGRFTPERLTVLQGMREALRNSGYLPLVFDFEGPSSRDITETISTLAHLAHFIIADLTDARSIPQELMAIVPNLPSVPVQPVLLQSQHEYGMFEHFKRYPWVLETLFYSDLPNLLEVLPADVIRRAEAAFETQARSVPR
jgi:uncharacterized protein YjbI with pentapeptide repeats